MWPPEKKAVRVNSGAIIFKSNHVGCHFCSDFQGVLESSQWFGLDFREFCPDLMRFFRDFHQIRTFEGAVALPASLPPTPVSDSLCLPVLSLLCVWEMYLKKRIQTSHAFCSPHGPLRLKIASREMKHALKMHVPACLYVLYRIRILWLYHIQRCTIFCRRIVTIRTKKPCAVV